MSRCGGQSREETGQHREMQESRGKQEAVRTGLVLQQGSRVEGWEMEESMMGRQGFLGGDLHRFENLCLML